MFEQSISLVAPGYDAARVSDLMNDNKLAALVLTSPESIYYLTGYPVLPTSGNPILYSLKNIRPYSLVILPDARRTLICWDFSLQDVAVDAEHVRTFKTAPEAFELLTETIAEAVALPGSGKEVGVEADMPLAVERDLEHRLATCTFRIVSEALRRMRRTKTQRELSLLRESVRIAEAAVAAVFEALEAGVSRLDMMQLAKESVLANGGDGVGHVTMSFGHANPEIAADETLVAGDLAVVDVGAKKDGYTSDCRRYGYVGRIPTALDLRHKAMCEVVDVVGRSLVPGTTCAEIMQVARTALEERHIPVPPRLTHVGHGIGLETEEEWLDDDPDVVIEKDMVVAIELYSEADGYGVVGDEETYVVHPEGPEQLTRLPVGLRAL